jgi:pimeloyl-ACP methyl ester carboxylesterase
MLHLIQRGTGTGVEPVVLLHGFGVDGRSWDDVSLILSAHRRVIIPDLPGAGPAHRAHSGLFCAASEILRVLDALEISRAHFVGHSFGAAIAVDIAFSDRPRVRSLSLVDPILLASGGPSPEQLRLAELAKGGDLRGALDAWYARPAFASVRKSPSLAARLRAMIDDYAGAHWTGKLTQVWSRHDHASALATLTFPTLVVRGSDVPDVSRGFSERYAQDVPGARLAVLDGVGHYSPMEAPGRLAELLMHHFRASN